MIYEYEINNKIMWFIITKKNKNVEVKNSLKFFNYITPKFT